VSGQLYYDSHVHSKASPDSEMTPEDAIAAVKKSGLGIVFTEHVDFCDISASDKDPLATDAPRGVEEFGVFVCNFDEFAKYEKFRGDGVSLGLEIGLTKAFLNANIKAAAGDYDYIIGSVHNVDGVEFYHACHGKCPEEPFAQMIDTAPEECIRRYLTYATEMVEISGFFDAFGHIDYTARYLPRLESLFSYENFADEIDSLLRVIARRDIALEINTCILSKPAAVETMQKICRRFTELGGRLCTIGSDAHNASDLGRNFKDALEIAERAGLAVVHFKERKPIRCG
jgi:histidinol-phosphatase (PHP family)